MSNSDSFSDQLRQLIRDSEIPPYKIVGERISKRALYDFLQGKSIRSDTIDALLELIGANIKLPAARTVRQRLQLEGKTHAARRSAKSK